MFEILKPMTFSTSVAGALLSGSLVNVRRLMVRVRRGTFLLGSIPKGPRIPSACSYKTGILKCGPSWRQMSKEKGCLATMWYKLFIHIFFRRKSPMFSCSEELDQLNQKTMSAGSKRVEIWLDWFNSDSTQTHIEKIGDEVLQFQVLVSGFLVRRTRRAVQTGWMLSVFVQVPHQGQERVVHIGRVNLKDLLQCIILGNRITKRRNALGKTCCFDSVQPHAENRLLHLRRKAFSGFCFIWHLHVKRFCQKVSCPGLRGFSPHCSCLSLCLASVDRDLVPQCRGADRLSSRCYIHWAGAGQSPYSPRTSCNKDTITPVHRPANCEEKKNFDIYRPQLTKESKS